MNTPSIRSTLCAVALVAAASAPALAAVNCGIVNKDLERGKKAEDIAERMGISTADVRECKEQGGGTTAAGTPPGQANTSPKGATPPAVGEKAKRP